MTHVVIPLYEGVTPLDFIGPYQLLRALPQMDIELAAIDRKEVVADGLTFGALHDLERIEACDILLVPGGLGCIAALETPSFLAAIRRLAEGAAYVTSVCTGSLTVQLWLEYAPAPPFDAGRPESAPAHIRNGFLEQMRNVLDDARRRVALLAQQQPTHTTTPSAPSL